MASKSISKLLLVLIAALPLFGACCAMSNPTSKNTEKPHADDTEQILEKLHQKTNLLQSYQSRFLYTFEQPLFESKTLRTGRFYYKDYGSKSKLRINFSTLKQDEQKAQKYREDYIFDGVWLTHIDYHLEAARMKQLAEPNKPIGALELLEQNFPIVGFGNIEKLSEQFEVSLLSGQNNDPNFICLLFSVKPDSPYRKDYTRLELRLDEKLYLPARITALTTEQDIYELEFSEPQVNKKINDKIFKVRIPEKFGEPEIIPLQTQKNR